MITNEELEVLAWGRHQVKKLENKWLKEEIKDVTWEDFYAYEVGKWYQIGDIELIILARYDHTMVMLCLMPKGSELPNHLHSTHSELFQVIYGVMRDYKKHHRFKIVRGEDYTYAPNEEHNPYTDTDTLILITANRVKS